MEVDYWDCVRKKIELVQCEKSKKNGNAETIFERIWTWEQPSTLIFVTFFLNLILNTSMVSSPGDVLIKNETIESKLISFRRQTLHRLEYKILNDDNLLSFAQIDIIDTDVGRRRMEIFSRYWFGSSFLATTRGSHFHPPDVLRNSNLKQMQNHRIGEDLPQKSRQLRPSQWTFPFAVQQWLPRAAWPPWRYDGTTHAVSQWSYTRAEPAETVPVPIHPCTN